MKLFAVVAKPVLHSLSPVLHNFALRAMGLDGAYVRLAVDSALEAVTMMRELSITGINISSPFKEDMLELVDVLDDDARLVEAVNTVVVGSGGKLYGYNTDIDGVTGALQGASLNISGSSVIVLGSGGAAKAAVQALLRLRAIPVVATRNIESAKPISQRGVKVIPHSEISSFLSNARGIISTVPSTSDVLSVLPLKKDHFVFDAIYKGNGLLEQRSRQAGALYIGGRQWLIHQAVKAFEYFTDLNPSIELFEAALKGYSAPLNRIFLTGLMGSGKSSVGKVLASELSMLNLDIDQAITEKYGPISAIFSQKGEEVFRALERETLIQAVESNCRCISCGGGITTQEECRTLIKLSGIGVWLWASVIDTLDRVKSSYERPLLLGDNPQSKLESILSQRRGDYAKVSSLMVPTGNRTVEEVAKRIAYEYRSSFNS